MPEAKDFITWKRLAPRSRTESFERNYQAQVRDPLWFLARQWQMGEFQGEDAASPYWVRLSAKGVELNQLKGTSSEAASDSYDIDREPLLKKIEGESALTNNVFNKVKIGQYFETLVTPLTLDVERVILIINAFRQTYPIPKLPYMKRQKLLKIIEGRFDQDLNDGILSQKIRAELELSSYSISDSVIIEKSNEKSWDIYDFENRSAFVIQKHTQFERKYLLYQAKNVDEETFRFLLICSENTTDGISLLSDIVEGISPINSLNNQFSLTLSETTFLNQVFQELREWVQKVFGTDRLTDVHSRYWSNSQLEFQAIVSGSSLNQTDTSMPFSVFPGLNGELDWYSFDQNPLFENLEEVNFERITRDVYPTNVAFQGMPNKRWWQFENNKVDFGSLRIEASEIDKIIFTAFLMKYSNDWYTVPFTLKVGSICKIEHLIVHDVFGGETYVERTDKDENDPWTMFTNTLSEENGQTSDYFLLAPGSSDFIQNGDPIEVVQFVRDEITNYVWAIEHTTENQLGDPWYGYERVLAGNMANENRGLETYASIRYILATGTPENWIPLVPVQIDETRKEVSLKKGAVPTGLLNENSERILNRPHGIILLPSNDQSHFYLREEEVPRSGVIVKRVYRRARWVDGSSHLWLGRIISSGRGEGRSNTRFDIIDDSQTASAIPPSPQPSSDSAITLDGFRSSDNSIELDDSGGGNT